MTTTGLPTRAEIRSALLENLARGAEDVALCGGHLGDFLAQFDGGIAEGQERNQLLRELAQEVGQQVARQLRKMAAPRPTTRPAASQQAPLPSRRARSVRDMLR